VGGPVKDHSVRLNAIHFDCKYNYELNESHVQSKKLSHMSRDPSLSEIFHSFQGENMISALFHNIHQTVRSSSTPNSDIFGKQYHELLHASQAIHLLNRASCSFRGRYLYRLKIVYLVRIQKE
jgi:hypothetical protein